MRTILQRLLALVMIILLAACAGDDVDDLRDYVAEVKAKPGRKIDPIPTFPPYQTYTYQVMTMRAPFSVPVKVKPITKEQIAVTNVKPDENRVKEFLENFQLETLAMVGTILHQGVMSGLIVDNTGAVHPVAIDNYIGKNHGRVIDVTSNQLDIVEIISNGAGSWVERPRALKLRESQ